MRIGLLLGLINEKTNQILEMQNRNKNENDSEEEVVIGDAKMLMNM